MPEVLSPKSPKSPRERITEFPHDELDAGEYVVNKEVRQRQGSESGSSESSGDLKTTKDGTIVLIPQPSEDPDDPLNWTWLKKHAVFLSLLPGCFLTDWVITWGTTMFQLQAPEFGKSVSGMSQSISGAIFMQGPGGLIAVPLVQRYGRLPVLFWSQLFTLVCTIGATYAKSYAGFTACRTLQGFFGAPPQVIGLSMIHDLFFFHERARKINIWAFTFLIGPYLGPFLSGFILEGLSWRNTFGVLAGFYGLSVLMILLLGDETLYNREGYQKDRTPGIKGRIYRLTGMEGIRNAKAHPSVLEVTKDLFGLLTRPYLLVPTFGFVTWITMWTIGIVSTISEFVLPPPYLFNNTDFSLLFLAPMIGTVLAEIWGHWFNDFLCTQYIRRHNGRYKPENRLWAVYPAWIIGLAGLILFGQAIEHDLKWVAIAFGWAMNCFSTLGTTAAISAYLLDVLPQHAALASAWINAFRTVGGFTVTYFQIPWDMRSGPAVLFGCQAAIVGFFIVSIIATQIWGAKWRKSFPAPLTSRTM